MSIHSVPTKAFGVKHNGFAGVTLLFCLIGWACGQLDDQVSKQQTLVVWHAYEEGGRELAFLSESVSRFAKQHAEIPVRLVAVPFEPFANKIRVSVPRGNGPDVFIFAHDQLGDWASKRLVEPLGIWVDSDWMNATEPAALDALSHRGELYGIPLVAKTLALFYHKERIKNPATTTQELRVQLETLVQSNPELVGLAYDVDDLFFHAPWLLGFGGALISNGTFVFDKEPYKDGFIRSLVFVRDWVRTGLMAADISYDRMKDKFKKGQVAYILSGPWLASDLPERIYGVTPLPKISEIGGKPARPFMSVEGVFVSAHSKRKADAVSLLKFLSSKEEATRRKLETEQLVTRMDTNPSDSPLLAAFERQIKHAIATPNSPRMKALWTPLNRVLSDVIKRGRSPSAALQEARKLLERGGDKK